MLLSFVFLSLLVSPVLSLKCYVCSSSATNEECNQNSQTCQRPLDTCMTITDTFGKPCTQRNLKAIVKLCASKATCNGAVATASVDSDGNGNTVNCCSSHNLCNVSGANAVCVHRTLILLSVCMLLLRTH